MGLKDIIGQDRAIAILKGCVAKDRIPHALFFTGDEGIGKKLTAMNFAKALQCLKSVSEDLFSSGGENQLAPVTADGTDACDTCPSCTKIEKGNHPDVLFIAPEGDGRQITVSAIRQLQDSLAYKPFEGKWKVAIIDNAEKLNPSAANAFLQTLEEPSAQSILILISSRPDMLLPTIRSRCQRITFSPLPVDTMGRLLRKNFDGMDEGESKLLGTLSGGRLGYALNDDLIDERDRSFNIIRHMIEGLEDDTWEDKETMEDWFEWSQLVLRDIAVYKATGETGLLINHDRKDEIMAIARGAELRDILKLARDLYNIKTKLIFNLNKQLTFNHVRLLVRKNLLHGAR
jgi:DNA polymerase-3 subunit delta'